jgi:broad specificity phosphatase PhoE
MAELYLVRHGQASFGSDNYDKLSPLGHQQAQWLGDYFRDRSLSFDSILMGDLVRHRETAEGIAKGMQLQQPQYQVFSGLNEFDFHALLRVYMEQFPQQALAKDAPPSAFYKLLKKSMQLWSHGELEGDLPETWTQFEERVAEVLKSVQDRLQGQRVLAVSSGGAISMALRQILQAPSETVIELNLQTRNTGVSHCFFNQRSLRLSGFNSVPHLDHPERLQHITFS